MLFVQPGVFSAANPNVIKVTNTENSASVQVATFEGTRGAGVATANDEAYISLNLKNSAGVQSEYVRLTWKATDVTSGTMDGRFSISVITNNILTEMFRVDSTAASAVTTTFIPGQTFFPDGSAAAPSIAFTNSTGMGFSRAAADQLRISLAGIAKLLYSAGALAFQEATTLSTTSGDFTFTPNSGVVNVTNSANAQWRSTSGFIVYGAGAVAGANSYMGSVSNHAISIITNNINRVVIDATGSPFAFQQATTISTTAGALTLAPVSGSNLAFTVAGIGNIAFTLGTGTVTGVIVGTGWNLNAQSIAGAGTFSGALTFNALTTLGAGIAYQVVSKTANYTIVSTDQVVFVDATAGAVTITLPAATTKQFVAVVKTDASANAVTVSRAGTDTIQGATTVSLAAQYNKFEGVSNGTATWFDLGTGLI